MSRPHIGSHSDLEAAHYWHFARTSGLPRGTFDKPRQRSFWTPCLTIAAGFAVGLIAGVLVRAFF
jgi:hypothetical protein